MTPLKIYADYNAQSPVRPEVKQAIEQSLALCGNPSSVHRGGRASRALLENARDNVASAINAQSTDVIFTSGGTEANNLAIQSVKALGAAKTILISRLEHDSLWFAVRASGLRVDEIPVLQNGVVDFNYLHDRLSNWDTASDGIPFVCLMLANNETGVIQPVREVSELTHRAGGYLMCDAVQGLGRTSIDIEMLGADYLSLSAHKIGGLTGCGALVVRGNSPLTALIYGGGQERGRRAGTENFLGVIAFDAALVANRQDQAENARVSSVRDEFESTLLAEFIGARVIGGDAKRLGNTSCVATRHASAELIVMAADMEGLACSAGAACSSGKIQPSRALMAMGLSETEVHSAVRFSFGWNSAKNDGALAAQAYASIIRRLEKQRAA